MKLKKSYTITIIFLILGFILFISQDQANMKESNLVFLLLAFLFVPILRFLFPKLREIGFGTSEFFPYLLSLFKKK